MSKVFISYSHDSIDHSNRVLSFAQALRDHGIDVELDQFHEHEILDWPRWCNEQISRDRSDLVLCLCTSEYNGRLEGKVPPEKGKGVYWEGSLIDDELYDEKGNRRFIPILFDDELEGAIPRILRGWTFCRLRNFTLSDTGYEQVIRMLTKQARVSKNALGSIPTLNPRLAPNSQSELQGVDNGATGTSQGPRTAPGPDEEIRKLVNDKIEALLQDPSMKSILASIGKQLAITTTDDHLLAVDSAKQLTYGTVADALTILNLSIIQCAETYEQKGSALNDKEWQSIEEIIGWLVIQTVDPDWLTTNRSTNAGSTGNVRLEIPAQTKIGVEAAVACLFKKSARFQKDPAETLKLVPRNAHYTGILETGVDLDNRYRHILTNIHYSLFKEHPDTNKWDTLEEFLNETIRSRNEEDGENHYVLVEDLQNMDEKSVEDLIGRLRLLDKLPVIKIVASGKVLTVGEPTLAAQIYNIMRKRTN